MPKIEIDVVVIEKKKVISKKSGKTYFFYKGLYKGKDNQEVCEWISETELPLNQAAKVSFVFGSLKR